MIGVSAHLGAFVPFKFMPLEYGRATSYREFYGKKRMEM
jgi:hypothetical protein